MPTLTTAQLQALKADILADQTLANQPMTSAGSQVIAAAYAVVGNLDVWRTDAPVSAIYDAIDWTKFTPTGAMDDASLTDATVAARRQAQLLAIQTKQMNLQNMLQGRTTVDASKANIRAGLRDAVIQLPAGTNGAGVAAGGTNGTTVLNALVRKANRFEALYATTQATTGAVTANLLVVEGQVTSDQIQQARELP